MRYYLLAALFAVILSPAAWAQNNTYPQAPDNDMILAEIIEPASPSNYLSLFSRYTVGDTTLNLEDYRRLYYGFVWQDAYKPFEPVPARERLLMLFEKKGHTVDDCLQIIENAKEVMRSDPFSPSNINFMIYAYGAIGDTVNERINYHRLRMIEQAILSTGTGVKEASPWHIINFAHAVDIMGGMDLPYKKAMVVSRSVEFFPLIGRGPQGEKGYYFNFERVYWKRPDKIPEKRSAGWEFNGLPLKKR